MNNTKKVYVYVTDNGIFAVCEEEKKAGFSYEKPVTQIKISEKEYENVMISISKSSIDFTLEEYIESDVVDLRY